MILEMYQTLTVFYGQLNYVNSINNIQGEREAHFEFMFLQKYCSVYTGTGVAGT